MDDILLDSLRKLVKVSPHSQSELSSMFGVNKFTFNRWIKGKQRISPAYRRLISRSLKKFC